MSVVTVAKYIHPASDKILNADEYRLLIETALKTLAGEATLAGAIKKYLPPGIIGMKVNCLTRNLNSTPVAMVDGLVNLMTENGFEENNLIVWERTSRELEQAGFQLNASSFGRRCFGTDANGLGYGRNFHISGDVSTLISRIVTDKIDYNINLPVLKDHSIAGLSGCLKNMYGAIYNPNKYHGNNCDPFAADISCLEPIKMRHRLSIIDATRIQYNGGPGFDSRYLDYYNGLIISDDPVAADRMGLEILEYFRKKNNLPSLENVGRPVKYLKSAEERGIGTADPAKIDLKVIEVNQGGQQKTAELF